MSVLRDIAARTGIGLEEMAYMGDDMPDIPALEAVGLSCCPKMPPSTYVCVASVTCPAAKAVWVIEAHALANGIWQGEGLIGGDNQTFIRSLHNQQLRNHPWIKIKS